MEINFKSVDRLNKIIKALGVGIIIPILLFFIFIAILVWFVLKMYWYNGVDNRSILEYLEEIYDEKYEIISQESDSEGNIIYKLALKDNKNIICTGYESIKNSKSEDSQAYKLKYFFENWDNIEVKNKFTPYENYYNYTENPNINFLNYYLETKIDDYNELENAVYNTYILMQYCKVNNIYGYVILLRYNDFVTGFGQNEENLEYNDLLDKSKNDYLKYLEDNNINN